MTTRSPFEYSKTEGLEWARLDTKAIAAHYDQSDPWQWPRYNPPGLLIGPLPHKRTSSGGWVLDYDHPGVAERMRVEVDFIEDQVRRK